MMRRKQVKIRDEGRDGAAGSTTVGRGGTTTSVLLGLSWGKGEAGETRQGSGLKSTANSLAIANFLPRLPSLGLSGLILPSEYRIPP